MTARRRSEQTLAACAKETALDTANRLARESDRRAAVGDEDGARRASSESRRLRDWLNRDTAAIVALLRSLPSTRGGAARELRVGMCGVAFVARRGEQVGFARRGCKDRLCPDCGARRSRRLAAALREQVTRRAWAPDSCLADPPPDSCDRGGMTPCTGDSGASDSGGGCICASSTRRARGRTAGDRCSPMEAGATRVLFVTLTQRKVAWQEPREALDRLLASFKRFRQTVWFKRYVVGGLRAIECTARGAGDRVGDYVVGVPGIHAHLHCLFETRAGVRAADIAAMWVASADDAEASGVDVQEVTDANIFQCADYPVNMSGLLDVLTCAPDYVRRVVMALHGRRLVEPLGAWRAWDLGLREEPGSLVYGDRAVYTLAANDPDVAATFRWNDGRVEPTDEVLRAFLDGAPEPLSGAGSRVADGELDQAAHVPGCTRGHGQGLDGEVAPRHPHGYE